MIGLKRGTVLLCNHQTAWEENAAKTIETLRSIFGNADDVQHIGSTAIPCIKAKPILDIAVAVRNLDAVKLLIPELEKSGFYLSHSTETDMLFVQGDFENDTRTHHIHIVLSGSMEWLHYINFRNFLNTFPKVAKQYETLKLDLMQQYPTDREAYTNGKAAFIAHTLRKALVWSFLGKTVTATIDRPLGSIHPVHNDILYPVNYGYLPGILGGDGEALDVYVLGVPTPLTMFTGRIIGIVHRANDTEDKLVAAPKGMLMHQAQIAQQVNFQERYFVSYVEPLYHKSCGVIVYRRINGQTEYLLLFQGGSQTWSFPKGHMECGETELQTAKREVFEETGLTVQPINGFRQEVYYTLPPEHIKQKTVVLFLAETLGCLNMNPDEVADYRWACAKHAKQLLIPAYAQAVQMAEAVTTAKP